MRYLSLSRNTSEAGVHSAATVITAAKENEDDDD
jgi:hypothetical protein